MTFGRIGHGRSRRVAQAHPHTVLPETVKHYLETIFYIEREESAYGPVASPSGWA